MSSRKFTNIDEWIDDAVDKLNNEFKKLKEDKQKTGVRITLHYNPKQTVEVEPDLNADFEAEAR
jgi:hypothetical protein